MSAGPPDGLIDAILRRLARIQRRLDDLGDEVDRARRQLGAVDPTALQAERRGAGEVSLRAAARHGVAAVSLERQSPVSILRIEGVAMELPDGLADLVERLLDDPGGEPGPLIGWTSSAVLRAELGKRGGRSLSAGALRMQIHKLRERLRHAGQNPFLVQTSRKQGARFARRRLVADRSAAAHDG